MDLRQDFYIPYGPEIPYVVCNILLTICLYIMMLYNPIIRGLRACILIKLYIKKWTTGGISGWIFKPEVNGIE